MSELKLKFNNQKVCFCLEVFNKPNGKLFYVKLLLSFFKNIDIHFHRMS